MDWQAAIEKNRAALLRIVDMLFEIAGLAENKSPATLPRCTRNYLLRILRPAESAVRRLIVVAARGIEIVLRPASPSTGRLGAKAPAGAKPQTSALPLMDPRKRFDLTPRRRYAKTFPRITCIGLSEPTPIPEIRPPAPGDPLDAKRLCARLHALKVALDDIPGQAKRLARLEARRDLGKPRKMRLSPMRPGWPPGHRKRPYHEIDYLLRECHSLAVWALKPDTS